ncbi:nucleoporin interacting component Nup93/Nic96 [Pilaira anomala]|nr:nucleoporin interacting component Nup93/Nic96 [Pilaira anomala]
MHLLEENRVTRCRDSRRRMLEEWDEEQEDLKFGRKGKDQKIQHLKEQLTGLSKVVKDVNKNRLLSAKIPIIKEFKSLSESTQCDKAQERSMLDSWDIASCLTKESIGNTFLVTDPVKRNIELIKSSKTWLENMFMTYVNDTLHKHAVEAKVGGVPSLKHRMQVFMKTVFFKQSVWIDDRFEIQTGIPIWLYLYLLIRTGNHKLALEFVQENPIAFSESPSFAIYLNEYFSSPENLVSEDHRKEILAEYQKMFYGNIVVDPYKVLLYKIIGRCELENKTIPEVIRTMEDFMWFELCLVRERRHRERYQFEHYRLSHFQKKIYEAGPTHFDPHGTNPWYYFKILLLSLQFEKAIDHLYKSENFGVEAVHFGIALAYHQLLSNSKNPRSTSELLVTEVNGDISLNFAHLISRFVRSFLSTTHDDALHYLLLITLYPTEDMTFLCRDQVLNYIVGCKEYKDIIGCIDENQGRVQSGSIEAYKPLIGIDRYDIETYRNIVLYPIAQRFDDAGNYKDAVSVYEFAGKYTDALEVLNRQLDYALDRPINVDERQHARDQNLIEFSYSVLTRYKNNTYIECDDNVLNTHKTLRKLLEAALQFEQEQYEKTVQLIKSTHIFPESNEFESIYLSAIRFDKEIDYMICKHISEVLMMIMQSYHQLSKSYSTYNPNLHDVYQANIESIKNDAMTLLSFVGLIDFKLPSNVIRKLNEIRF